jgi:hypothetical protein
MATTIAKMLLVPLAFALLALPMLGQQSSPDVILLNGKVFTSDSSHPYVEALAIRGDRIVSTGSSKEIAALAGPQTKRIVWQVESSFLESTMPTITYSSVQLASRCSLRGRTPHGRK